MTARKRRQEIPTEAELNLTGLQMRGHRRWTMIADGDQAAVGTVTNRVLKLDGGVLNVVVQ